MPLGEKRSGPLGVKRPANDGPRMKMVNGWPKHSAAFDKQNREVHAMSARVMKLRNKTPTKTVEIKGDVIETAGRQDVNYLTIQAIAHLNKIGAMIPGTLSDLAVQQLAKRHGWVATARCYVCEKRRPIAEFQVTARKWNRLSESTSEELMVRLNIYLTRSRKTEPEFFGSGEENGTNICAKDYGKGLKAVKSR